MQTDRKRNARKDRVYQHVQNQLADQAIARAAKKNKRTKQEILEEKVSGG